MNNKKLLLLLALFMPLAANAQLDGDGFYRVQNADSKRYISIKDNTSSTKSATATTTPDLTALISKASFDNVVGDLSTVIYVIYVGTRSSDDYYNLLGQGANVYEMVNHYLYVKEFTDDDYGTYYKAWAEDSGLSFFLSDQREDYEEGAIGSNGSYNKWYILPISADNDDNYFGIDPEISYDGKYYTTIYSGFPMQAASDGVKFYYIQEISDGYAFYAEIDGVVPAETPVVVECSSADPSDNRVELLYGDYTAISDNYLGGVMFHAFITGHPDNGTLYDETTMRVFGTLSDGTLGFYKASASDYDDEALPANTAYLNVSTGSADEFRFIDITSGIKTVSVSDDDEPSDIYTLTGIKVGSNAASLDGLAPGVYIYKNKKVVVK